MTVKKRKGFGLLLLAACLWLGGCDAQGLVETEAGTEITETESSRFDGYAIVRPDSTTEGTIDAAVALRKGFETAGMPIEMTTDWVNRGEEVPVGTPEILVGDTNRPESARYAGTLRYHEFAVAKEGERYVISGGSDAALADGCQWFLDNVLLYSGEEMSAQGDQYIEKAVYFLEDARIGGTPVGEFTILYTGNQNAEPEIAAQLQASLQETTGWTLVTKKISIVDLDKYEHQILMKVDSTMDEGYRITLENGSVTVCGSDRVQFRSAVHAWKKSMEEGSMPKNDGIILEGKMEKQPLTLYADAGAAGGGNGTEAAPFATGDELMAGLLKTAGTGAYEITVQMKAGDYPLSAAMELHAETFGLFGSTVHFVCQDGEQARFCAWMPVTGFTETTVNGAVVWAADLPTVPGGEKLAPNQCFTADGVRLERPRYPQEGELTAELPGMEISEIIWNQGMDRMGYSDPVIETFTRPQEIQIHMFHYWDDERLEIQAIDTTEKLIHTRTKSGIAFIEYSEGAPYYLDNVYEMLGTVPGQFYTDKTAGRLYYVPAEGDTLEGFTLYASGIDTFLTIDGLHGKEDAPAVTFRNIGFAGSDWKSTNRASTQAASDIRGALRINDSAYISFIDCSFAHIGDYAMEIEENVSYLTVSHCRFEDLGAGGITIFGDNAEQGVNHHLTIEDNYIAHYGRVHTNGIGIVLRYAYDCSLSHNEIHDGFYTGISVGWSWGYDAHVTKNILVEKNHIYQIGQYMLSDMGGIYTLGLQPGTVIRGNLIHNVYARSSKAWGLYTDEGSTGILLENNIAYDVKSEAFHQHYGKENIVRNNILALGHDGVVMVSRLEEHIGIHLERNILLADGVPVYLQHPQNMTITDDSNLVWNLSGDVYCTEEGLTVEQVQEMGLFRNVRVADPGFADPKNGDFTLPADSPAYDIGFQPIDMSDVGIRD